jgi:phosphate transport system substrate-binding protein
VNLNFILIIKEKSKMYKIIIALTTLLMFSSVAVARDQVSIAGSSTVLPFARIIAEEVGKTPSIKTPVVESGGSSVGKKGVCDGIGTKFIDIGNASSRMKTKELKYCDDNGVKLTEIKVGYDGIVVASSKKGIQLNISKADLARALTAKVAINGKMVDNPYKKWSDINPALPNLDIRVYGPPTTSGTRASYVEMINEKGYCGKDADAKVALKALGKKAKMCRAMRTDGAFIEAGEQDNLIVQKLIDDPTAYGIFGFSYLDQNSDTLNGAIIDGGEPTFEAIADGDYAVSRALYFYVKHQHIGVVPGIEEYMSTWVKNWNEDGILSDAGMIPMPKEERAKYAKAMKELPVLTADMLKK